MGNDPLLEKLKAGEPDAFKTLYTTYYSMLYIQAFRVVQDEFIAKDLVQECFIEIFEKKTYLQVHKSLQALLVIIIRRKCYHYFRKQRQLKEKEKKYQLAEAHRQEGDNLDFLTNQFQNQDIQNRNENIRKILTELSPQHRKVIDQVYIHGKSHAAAAQALGMNHRTVQTYVYRAVNKLKKYMHLAS